MLVLEVLFFFLWFKKSQRITKLSSGEHERVNHISWQSIQYLLWYFSLDRASDSTVPGALLPDTRISWRIFGWLQWTDTQSWCIQLLFVLRKHSTSTNQQPRRIWSTGRGLILLWGAAEASSFDINHQLSGDASVGATGWIRAAGRGPGRNLEWNGTLRCVSTETRSCCDILPWCSEGSEGAGSSVEDSQRPAGLSLIFIFHSLEVLEDLWPWLFFLIIIFL